MNGRIADTLLYIDSLKISKIPIYFNFFREKIWPILPAVSTESAVKLLKSFEKDGLIELHEKDIVIVNYAELQEISKKG
jgi:hypothetical protein